MDYDRFNDDYEPEPDLDRPTRREAEAEEAAEWAARNFENSLDSQAPEPHAEAMTSAHTSDEQHRLVHQAIQAIAAHCDGAVERDAVGFDGTDTKYGRRIAAVDFETLTQDDREEEARIVLKYRNQALTYTGLDVSTLPVVLEAQSLGSNYNSRDNARRYERKAKNASKADLRAATLQADGLIALTWVKGDPEFGALLDLVRALPDRRWTGTVWAVKPSKELAAFIQTWDFPITPEAVAVLKDAAERPVYHVGVVGGSQGKRLWVKSGAYDPDRVADARQLPGRRWTGELDEVDAHPAVLAFAQRWSLVVSPKALAAIKAAEGDVAAASAGEAQKATRAGLMSLASRAGAVDSLPEEFINLVNRAIGA